MKLVSRKEAKEMGLPHYYTGTPCKHGHVSKRRTSNATCFECHLLTNGKWRSNNPEYMGSWYLENKDRVLDQQKEYYEKNKSEILAKCKEYRDSNREKISASWLDWTKRNKKKFRDIQRRYESKARKTPKGKMVAFMRNSVLRALNGKLKEARCVDILGYTHDDLVAHMERQFSRGMTWGNHGKFWHVDHIIPVSKFIDDGETDPKIINALSNLMPLRSDKNLSKGAKLETLL